MFDVGNHHADPVDYPDFAEAVGKAVLDGRAERGVLICGSGVGASVAANKLHGIRAGLCHDTYSAHQGVEHDDMNVLVLGARVIGVALAKELVEAYCAAKFTHEERHVRRLEQSQSRELEFALTDQIIKCGEETHYESTNRLEQINPLRGTVDKYGQSVWLDYIRRSLITSGELQRLIDEDGLRGVTSNPAIFEKAITGSTDYNDACWRVLAKHKDLDAMAIYEQIAIRDIQDAADALAAGLRARPRRRDGYVSLEVSPFLAHDTARHHRRSAPAVEGRGPREPDGQGAGDAGRPAGDRASDRRRHQHQRHAALRAGDVRKVALAYIAGLEKYARPRAADLSQVASVASFFISRIDTPGRRH